MRYAVFGNWRTANIASPRRTEAISDRYPLFKLLGECLQRFRMNREEHQFPQDLGIRGTRDGRDYVLGKRSKAGFQQIPQSQAQAFRSTFSFTFRSSFGRHVLPTWHQPHANLEILESLPLSRSVSGRHGPAIP